MTNLDKLNTTTQTDISRHMLEDDTPELTNSQLAEAKIYENGRYISRWDSGPGSPIRLGPGPGQFDMGVWTHRCESAGLDSLASMVWPWPLRSLFDEDFTSVKLSSEELAKLGFREASKAAKLGFVEPRARKRNE